MAPLKPYSQKHNVRPYQAPAGMGSATDPLLLPSFPSAFAMPSLVSNPTNPKDYRQDGARHIYKHNSHRIHKGQLPPLMLAVGVLNVDIDGEGKVRNLKWMRAPSHVPEVMQEIERTVRAAAPFPAPVRLGHVTYTDVWLWDKSGNFQLDTLTEGQLER